MPAEGGYFLRALEWIAVVGRSYIHDHQAREDHTVCLYGHDTRQPSAKEVVGDRKESGVGTVGGRVRPATPVLSSGWSLVRVGAP